MGPELRRCLANTNAACHILKEIKTVKIFKRSVVAIVMLKVAERKKTLIFTLSSLISAKCFILQIR